MSEKNPTPVSNVVGSDVVDKATAWDQAVKSGQRARTKALEEAARLAERDVDWSSFGKRGLQPWEGGVDDVRDYRLGIVAGRAIAAAIRALATKDASDV